MIQRELHSFHIPVMGTGFTIDTPLKVARFGISSVVSLCQDDLIELMRKYYFEKEGKVYREIKKDSEDSRAKRITAYLNFMHESVSQQFNALIKQRISAGLEIDKYIRMLPEYSLPKVMYAKFLKLEEGFERDALENEIKLLLRPGSIDVNIMTRLNKSNEDVNGVLLPIQYNDAFAALRGFALSTLSSSVVFSAGMNPKLYSYCELFDDFFPDTCGELKKKIILKVSNFRSAAIQGKMLASKGLWVSEFRIESALNCGGHAFPGNGALLGQVLQEFKDKRLSLRDELFALCNQALVKKEKNVFDHIPSFKVTAQGGVGTSDEHEFLLSTYHLDAVGWGSPFLLVPDASNVDAETLSQIAHASPEQYYLSDASPLGIPFNNFHGSSSDTQRMKRIQEGRPGSPCYHKTLISNTEFTDKPICTASRQYQRLKLLQLETQTDPSFVQEQKRKSVLAKECLCEGLSAPARMVRGIKSKHSFQAVAICPGPNLAYFSGVYTLEKMLDHIYGRAFILNQIYRPHVFVNELKLCLEYLTRESQKANMNMGNLGKDSLMEIKANLLEGIKYYRELKALHSWFHFEQREMFFNELERLELLIHQVNFHENILGKELNETS